MIDLAFDIKSDLTRSEFISAFSGRARKYIRPQEIRKMVEIKRKELNLIGIVDKLSLSSQESKLKMSDVPCEVIELQGQGQTLQD